MKRLTSLSTAILALAFAISVATPTHAAAPASMATSIGKPYYNTNMGAEVFPLTLTARGLAPNTAIDEVLTYTDSSTFPLVFTYVGNSGRYKGTIDVVCPSQRAVGVASGTFSAATAAGGTVSTTWYAPNC